MYKICFLKENMTQFDGVVRVIEMLAKELSPHYELHLVSICGLEKNCNFTSMSNIKFTVLKNGNVHIRETLINGSRLLKKYLKSNDIDALLIFGASALPVGIFGSLNINIPKVFCEHSNLESASLDRTDFFIRKVCSRFVDKIVTLTKQDMDCYLRSFKHIQKDNISYIHNWVDQSLFNIDSKYDVESKKIITVGRINSQKGLYDILDIGPSLFSKHPDWEWDLYGDGPDLNNLKALTKANNLDKNIHFVGSANNIYNIYGRYAFYVSTSYREGMPMVFLEAKSQRLPIISYDCPTGPKEIVRDGIDGYIVSMGDKTALLNSINRLIENSELRESFSKQATENLCMFDKTKIINQWIDFIDNICKIKTYRT